ncbi:hypothetical protein UFOVP714_47 [uncultured Caudovirales phage]|jgi:hypothetical protein|uniref:Uncharacterized protein n=1 Tax=uncultured Caudovirales phage TaxID=2100421 RepID=A0A6J5NNK8_9CAUD|nr:hypothetical protein UFOVP714_47 [uncultured Caudovirales phage]CAB4167326.1 hypothetical protein UFOVP864_13 [uncultured Caudovirales phage]
MATAMTFTTLKQDVQRYLERGNTLASDPIVFEQIPRLINLAERRIARELKIEGFINVVTGTLSAGQSVYPKPDRWRDTVSMSIGTGATLENRKVLFARVYEYLRSYWPNALETDTPLFYSDYDYSHWLLAPTPDAEYPFEILYYELPPLLDESVQTNWITEYAPQLLLYGTLVEATPFLKNDERIPVWQNMYDRAAAMLNGEDLAKILDRSAVRKEA